MDAARGDRSKFENRDIFKSACSKGFGPGELLKYTNNVKASAYAGGGLFVCDGT